MLKSDLCNYSDAHIAVKVRISDRSNNNANRRNMKLIFNNDAPFMLFTTRITCTFIGNEL